MEHHAGVAVSAVNELTGALIAAGMSPGDAAALVVRAGMEMGGTSTKARGRGALRMEQYRDRREAMGLPRIFKAEQFLAPLEARDGRRCIYCETTEGLVIDHIDPLFLGGNDDLGNLGFACRPCNGGKAGKSLEQAGMKIVVESAHVAHKAHTDSLARPANTERTIAHNSEHVRGTYLSSSISLETDSVEKKEKQIEAPPRKRASRLPDDWRPDQHDIDAALRKGLSVDRIPAVAEKFRNHWLTKSRKDTSTNWHLNWCTWVMNEIDWNGGRNGKAINGRKGGFALGAIGAGDQPSYSDPRDREPSSGF